MMKLSIALVCNTLTLFAVVFNNNVVQAWPDREIKSREYKTMMKASLFNGSDPSSAIAALKGDLAAAATTAGASSSGSFSLKSGMPRTVKFYDTSGDCKLNSNAWAFRVRREDGETDWEGTLKSRSGDRYFSTYRAKDMNQCGTGFTDLGGKFEEDVTLEWKSKFSYSHKCEIPDSKNINKLDDVADVWDEMQAVMENDMGWDLDDAITLVSDLTVTEMVYKGFEVDFDDGGSNDIGEFAITLWYDSPTSTTPALAEMSFTIEDNNENWGKDTIMTAFSFWEEVKDMTYWLDPASSTKTVWAYEYDSFCT